jgi:class 3 adenylate cyclase
VASVVRDLCIGKGFKFEDRGQVELKGFSEPARIFEVAV